jgi:hypothetical protein
MREATESPAVERTFSHWAAAAYVYAVTFRALAFSLVVATLAGAAHGQPTAAAPPPDATAENDAPPPDVAAGERSDGRLDPPPRRRWRLLPEVLLFPLRGLFWLLQWPIGGAVRFEDRHHAMARLVSFVTWNDGERGLRPAFYYSTISVPEFGLTYYDHLSLGFDTRLTMTATTGGARYIFGAFSVEPTRVSGPVGIVVDVLFDRRADLLYDGLGSHTYSNAPNGRYLMNALETRVALRVRPLRALALFLSLGSGLKRFGNGDRIDDEPGVIYVYDTSRIAGFDHGTTFVRAAAGFSLDSRDAPNRAATGVVLSCDFAFTHGLDGDRADYERLSASLGVPIDLWSRTHVLYLRASTAMIWQNDAPVPFSELPALGGPNDLRGFRFQDFRDYTALWGTAEYRWPLWMWVDGSLFVDYGGVFGQNFAGFGTRRAQPDVGVGLRIVTAHGFLFRAQLGYGFGEGFNFSIAGNAP